MSVYPVLMTDKIETSCQFYKTYFGCTETYTSDWYISLLYPDGNELALIDTKHHTIPDQYRSLAKGMIINIEVENATQTYNDILKLNDNTIVMALRDEDYGQRHFMMQDPNGILIDIIEVIPPSEEFQNNYSTGGV